MAVAEKPLLLRDDSVCGRLLCNGKLTIRLSQFALSNRHTFVFLESGLKKTDLRGGSYFASCYSPLSVRADAARDDDVQCCLELVFRPRGQ